MSEGDVSLIRDEDVLRRMWQQTEDFTRKKEIRTHMYRLREERLRNLYSPEPPSLDAKSCESQTHTKSFADQSFQHMKSKEVRDAGSPPKEFTYRGQDLKELSNAGWNVESENTTTDDGHTHVKNVQANIEGKYDVEGGKGQFVAVDKHKQAVTEYHDDNTSLKRNESSSNTAAHEQVVRQTDDGSNFSETTNSSSSTSKFQQVSSTKHESVPYYVTDARKDNNDLSRSTFYDTNRTEKVTKEHVTKTSDYEQNLRNNYEQGEIVSRKVEYPDDNTKVVVETRCLPDGTKITSTRREFRAPVTQSSHSEHHSQQTRNESKQYHTSTQRRSNVQDFSSKSIHESTDSHIRDIVDAQRTVDDVDFHKQHAHSKIIERDNVRDIADSPRNSDDYICNKKQVDYSRTENNQHVDHSTTSHKTIHYKTNQQNVDDLSTKNITVQKDNDYNIKKNKHEDYLLSQKNDFKQTVQQRTNQQHYESTTCDEQTHNKTLGNKDITDIRNTIVIGNEPLLKTNIPTGSQYAPSEIKPEFSSDYRHSVSPQRSSVSPEKKPSYPARTNQSPERKQRYEEPVHNKSTAEYPSSQSSEPNERIHTVSTNKEENNIVQQTTSNDNYQTTYENDYIQRKISTDWSPTHQAWASTLRSDTPSTTRPSTRASSPGGKTFKSSTSSIRSSISPEKSFRKQPSRGGSPHKIDRSPSRTSDKYSTTSTYSIIESTTNRYRSPDQKIPYSGSPTRSNSSPDRKPHMSSERSSVSPEKKPKNLQSPSVSPDRKTKNYPRTTSPSRPINKIRLSQSPEKKPTNKPSDTTSVKTNDSRHSSPQRLTISTNKKFNEHTSMETSKISTHTTNQKSDSLDSKDRAPTISRSSSPSKTIPSTNTEKTPSISPDRKSENPNNPTSSRASPEKYPKESLVKIPNSTSNKKTGYMRPTAASQTFSDITSPPKRESPDRKSPTKSVSSHNPDGKSYEQKITVSTKIKEDHYKFIDEETKQFSEIHKQNYEKTKYNTKSNPERCSHEKSPSSLRKSPVTDVTDYYRAESPLNTPLTYINKNSRSPSPSKRPVTITKHDKHYDIYDHVDNTEKFEVTNESSTKDTRTLSSEDKQYSTPKQEFPSRETSPSKYGTYDKKRRYSEEIEDHNTESEIKKSVFNKIPSIPNSPTKKSPQRSVSPTKSPTKESPTKTVSNKSPNKESATPNKEKYKHTTDFITTERTTEEINKTCSSKSSQKHPRQLITPSSSPTRKPKPVEPAPSTGQSSPTTSVSGFVYFSSPKRPDENMITDLDDEKYYSEDITTNETVSSYKRPEFLNVKRSPSPSKIPCRSPSPEKRSSPGKDSLPRKSSLKKPVSDVGYISPIEKPPSSFRVSPTFETEIDFTDHKIVKKHGPNIEVDSPVKSRPPFERRETYEERCKKILGMVDDNTKTTTEIKENTQYLKEPESNRSSPSVSPCRSPGPKENSPFREYSINQNSVDNKVSSSDYISVQQQDTITENQKISKYDKNIKNLSRDASPTKLQDIILESTSKISSDMDTDKSMGEKTTVTSTKTNVMSSKLDTSPSRNTSQQPSNIPTQNYPKNIEKFSGSKHSRTPSPIKKVNKVTEYNTEFIMTEREQEIIDKVQKSLRKLSPDRNNRSAHPEKILTQSPINLQNIEINAPNDNVKVKETKAVTEKQIISEQNSRTVTKNDNKKLTEKRTTIKDVTTHTVKPKDDKQKDISSKPPSRNVSPTKKPISSQKAEKPVEFLTKSRSNSPRKPLSPTARPQSPQVIKTGHNKLNEQPVISKKSTPGIPSLNKNDKSTDKNPTDIKQQHLAKKSPTKTISKPMSPNKTESEIKRVPTPKGIASKRETDAKVTRTASDTIIKTKKVSPQRIKSKPEIQVNDVTTNKTMKSNLKTQKPVAKEPHLKLSPKPKSATSLNTSTYEDEVIIDVEQAKSSRENSPDRICPTPIGFMDDVGTPRLPDEVSEPDDDFYKRTHHTIHETESIVDDIVEICEDEELFVKRDSMEYINETDECLLSVNDKVSKFTNKIETMKKPKDTTIQFKDTEMRVHSDFNSDTLKSDECLLSVSEKVNKFAQGSRDTKDNRSPSRRIVDEYDLNTVYQDDYTKLSVNDKANLFVETAENVKTSKIKPAQKIERPDFSNIDDSLKSDDCLLSVSDKVNKFVKTAEQFLNETHDVEEKEKKIKEQHDMIMKRIVETADDKNSENKTIIAVDTNIRKSPDLSLHHDKLGSFIKETESSHAKTKDYTSSNLKPEMTSIDRAKPVKITTLRSSEAVKKAKALFENISSTTQKSTKKTKLTDIGVIKKSSKSDVTAPLRPHLDNRSPSITDSEGDIPINIGKDRPSSEALTKPRQSLSPTRLSTKSPEVPRTKSPWRQTVETTTTTKTILSRYPTGEPVDTSIAGPEDEHEKPKDRIPGYQRPTKTSQLKEETKTVEEYETSTRRGSGKFGVELRRTSIERSTVSNERRRSSAEHPCIEDIFELDLLEQMLEKVVGYEQRRRIRAQIRVAKKKMESGTNFNTKTTKQEPLSTPRSRSPEQHSKTRSPERQPKTTTQKKLLHEPSKSITKTKNISPERTPKEQTKTLNGHIKESSRSNDKITRSPEKDIPKTVTKTRSPVRPISPDKKTRPLSPSRTTGPKSKSNRFNEYASAYMKKIGLNENDKMKFTDVKIKKVPLDDQKTTKRTDQHSVVDNVDHETSTRVDVNKTFETKISSTTVNSFSERKFSKDTIEVFKINSKRSTSPEKKRSPERKVETPTERLYQRTPSPDFKKPKTESVRKETIIKTVYDIDKKIPQKQTQEEKPSWVTNRNLKKITSETRTLSSKKIESEKQKYRAPSPSKVISKPIDVITSSYGPGPLDAEGRPLFGIKALRNGATNYQVKGTVIRQEFHSRNGSEPEGTVSVTAYSTEPEDLEKLLQTQGERPSRIHGLAAITTTKKFGGDTGTTLKEIHTKEERAALDHFTHSERQIMNSQMIDSGSQDENVSHTTSKADSLTGTDSVSDKRSTRTERVADTKSGSRKTEERRSERRVEERKNVRQSSVKSLTEKYIKSTSESSRSERSSYPKAGLILRTTVKDGVSGDEHEHETQGIIRTDSEHRLSGADGGERTVTTTPGGAGHDRSFLDSTTKVTGVQDILTRMKNADIVIEDGDTNEDSEARALLNKFLGATVLMAGMQGYVTEKPTGKITIKQETVRSSGGKVSSSKTVQEYDIEQCWDERVLRKLLDECTDYEQRRRLRARIRALMAEQEACATAVSDALAAAGESADTADTADTAESGTEAGDARGESLLLPLLQGLLGGGGERLLAGLGAAAPDVVADVRRSLARLRAALAPPTDHPQARALLTLADRLEDALDAADRLDGCKKKPRRRSRANRHTVGVTQEELEEARRLVDRDQLALSADRREATPPSAPISTPSASRSVSIEEPEPSERRESVDDEVSYHNAVAARQKPSPVAHSASFEATPKVNRDAKIVERRAPTTRKPEYFRHSMGDTLLQQQPQQQQNPQRSNFPPQPRMERRPSDSRNSIAAMAHKFNAQVEKVTMPARRSNTRPLPVTAPTTAPTVQQKYVSREERKRAPLYQPLPPTYNFAAPPSIEELSKPISKFNNSKRSRMKRANTIDVGKTLGGYRIDSDTDEENMGPVRGPIVPEFCPQTENDRKFLAFMQKNEQNHATVNGHANWSRRFGNIKNAFESRERDEHSRSSSSSSTKRFCHTNEEQALSSRSLRKSLGEVNTERPNVPWAADRKEPQIMQHQVQSSIPTTPPTSHPPVPQSPTRPLVIKPFVAKPIPVNQFSHAPMSAFKPPKKIISPTSVPPHIWSPPSTNNIVSPTAENHPNYMTSPKPAPTPSPPVPTVPWAAADTDKPRRVLSLAASKFEEEEEVTTVTSSVRRNSSEKTVSSTTTTKSTKVIESMTRPAPKPVSPFAKFRQLEKQNSTSSPNSPKTPQSPGSPSQPYFKFTDPALQASAVTIKERLLQWCRDKTRDYENVKLENFSTSWADGLAFCALVHHFLPNAFDYSKLTPEKRRHNFTLAFKVADEKAGIYPLLDVDDMVAMRKPDWKCVFTYVQSIHRRFKDQA